MASNNPERLALHAFADYYDVDLSSCDTFDEERDCIQTFIESHESIDMDTEVDFTVTAKLTFGITTSDLSWGEWWDSVSQDIQMTIADNGFDPQEVTGVELKQVWNFT